MMFRHPVIAAAAFCILLLSPGAAAAADGDYPDPWPAGDVTFTVPFGRGSEIDALHALIGETFAARTGKQFTVRYVDGRAGADAWAQMIDDPRDGTVLTAVLSPDVHLRSMQADSGVSLSTMAMCHIIAYMPSVLWAPDDSPHNSVNDVITAAGLKNGGFIVAGPGRYSIAQVASRSLDRQGGVRTVYIPYSGTVTAAKAVNNGQAEVFWGYSVPVVLQGASFKPLAVAAGSRVPSMPDTPTFRELGLEVVQGSYIAIAVPVETPELTRQEISEYFSDFARSAAFRENAAKAGFTPMDVGIDTLKVFLAQEAANAKKLAAEFLLMEQ